VNFYATYQPAWQTSPKLVELVEQWREIRDTQLPNLGRPIRQIALCDSGNNEPSAGLRLAPTHLCVSTPRRAVQINRPQATIPGRIDVRKSGLALKNQAEFQYKGRDVFDVLREFNEKQIEVRLIGTCFLDRIEQGAVASCQWCPPHGGKWLISAHVDPEDMIMEREEANNSVEMILDVLPSPHYFQNTPPCAIASVRVGRGILRSDFVESILAQQAGPEVAPPSVSELFPVDRNVKKLWDELREEAEQRSSGMPALAKRRTVTIRQGQTFTLIGSRAIDREHDVIDYTWVGPNLSIAGLEPDRIVDTSAPGRELPPGAHRYTLTVTDRAGLVSTDDVFVTVTRGSKNAADLTPVAISSLPNPMVPGQETTLFAVVQNQGSGNANEAFVVRLNVGNTKLGEQTVSAPLNGGDAIEVVFENVWIPTAGLHQLKVQVDATNKIAEASESNNILTVAQRIDGNAKPVADLGFTDFEVKAGEGLFLDAYRSFDPDGHITRYDWFIDNRLQTAFHGRRFRYEAPNRAGDHKVRLLIVDNSLPAPKISDPVEATIHVVMDHQRPPVARLMPRLVVRQGRQVTIPATGCYDPDGTLQSYLWKIRGAAQAVTGTQANYTVDTSQIKPGRYVVELTVTDNANQSVKADMPLYVVEAPNRAPVIQLPVAVSVVKGERATIDGSRSYDVDGTIAEYLWIVPKNGHVAAGSKLELDTAELGIGAHTVILALSDNLGATTTRPTTLWVLPPKGQPARSETGYENGKPMTKEELEEAEGQREEPESSSGSIKPPSSTKPLQGSTQPKLPPIKK
jgi:hypothetical protein